jgi:hypothetical protein
LAWLGDITEGGEMLVVSEQVLYSLAAVGMSRLGSALLTDDAYHGCRRDGKAIGFIVATN